VALLHIMVSAVFNTCHKVDKMIIDNLPVQYLERKPQFSCRFSEFLVFQEIEKIKEYLKKSL